MIRRPPRSTPLYSSAASDVYKRQISCCAACLCPHSEEWNTRKFHSVHREHQMWRACCEPTQARSAWFCTGAHLQSLNYASCDEGEEMPMHLLFLSGVCISATASVGCKRFAVDCVREAIVCTSVTKAACRVASFADSAQYCTVATCNVCSCRGLPSKMTLVTRQSTRLPFCLLYTSDAADE